MTVTSRPVADIAAPAISLTAVTKSYAAVQALRSVSFDLRRGEVLGLVGENGAGKSTLLGVLSGIVRPDSGQVQVNGRDAPLGDARGLSSLGVSVVVQEQALVEPMRVYENIYLGREADVKGPGTRASRLRRAARSLLSDIGLQSLDANSFVADLSFPQRQLVEIAKAFAGARLTDSSPVVLLDEPTSALSERETELLFALIERWRTVVSFVYVSHILQDVLRLCDRLVVLRDGAVVEILDNDGVTDSQLHELMVGRERSHDYYHEKEQVEASTAGPPVLRLLGVSLTGAFTAVNLDLRPGEILGLAGVVGSGKSELAAAVAGAEPVSSGRVEMSGRSRPRWSVAQAVAAGVYYIPPERALDSLFVSMPVRFNISIGFLDRIRLPWVRLLRLREERTRAAHLIETLAVKTPSDTAPIGQLSGGNQQKAVFARWISRTCRVLVLDDPTRGIDVGTREAIYGLIRQLAGQGVAVLLCAESLAEVIGLSDRIMVLNSGRVTADLPAPAHAKPSEVDVVSHMM